MKKGCNMYLLPFPKEINVHDERFIINYHCKIIIDSLCQDVVLHYAKILQKDVIESLGFQLSIIKGEKQKGAIYIKENTGLKDEEYQLVIDEEGIEITGGNNIGILYGIQTLRQIIRCEGAVVSNLSIKDYPSIKNRGFYHDVTRGRIPTLTYLKSFADNLSYYKINQLQLYVEHSFLFEDFSEMWRDDTPLTAQEIMELDDYCKNINIELVPSLSTFGHLFKLLNSKTYGHLCELPDYNPTEVSFLDRMQHHTIDVSNDESLILIKKMIEEFLPLFSSNHFNICADETFDLGKGKSKQLADEVGIKNMYVDYVKVLCEFLISKGKRPMFWGDIICGVPEAIKQLPNEVICLNWGYASNQREDETIALYNAGATQYICPGVGGWNQFINLVESSYKNISRMCTYAHKYQALGVLNTDWGDFGHINHPEFSTTGMIYGACFSWNENIPSYEDINKQISYLEYGDRTESFVSLIGTMADCAVFGWNTAIWYKEVQAKKSPEEQKKYFLETDLTNANEANETLNDLINNMYQIINSMDSSKRGLIKAYLVAAEGIHIFNSIGATISEYKFDTPNLEKKDPKKLAVTLEHWLYSFKEIWRITSKESELYLIQAAVSWYADYLREL